MLKWQQETAPNHLLCYTNEQLDQKQHFGVMVLEESWDEPQIWVEGVARDHWVSLEALEDLKMETWRQTEWEVWNTDGTEFEG